MNKKNVTLSEIRKSYTRNKKNEDKVDLWLYYVVRRLSFYPTRLFLKWGISANQTTYISMVVGILGCILLAWGNYTFKIIGALLVNCWIVIDCVDGNIARYKKSFSKYGDFIDTLSGYIMYTLIFVSSGVAAFKYPDRLLLSSVDGSIFLVLGLWAALATILSRLIYQKFLNTFPEAKSVATDKFQIGIYSIIYTIIHNIASFAGFLAPILLLATIFRFLGMFTILYALLNTGVLLIPSACILFKAKKFPR